MRDLANVLLTTLWVLLLVAYTAPLWLRRFATWDLWISVDPPSRNWIATPVLALLLLLPPMSLGLLTWWWVYRPHRA